MYACAAVSVLNLRKMENRKEKKRQTLDPTTCEFLTITTLRWIDRIFFSIPKSTLFSNLFKYSNVKVGNIMWLIGYF